MQLLVGVNGGRHEGEVTVVGHRHGPARPCRHTGA